ncbi:hypothetical protein [Kangiella koreensis]|uniref:Uncharacterized protein n=1 Tax=Kangiella koreensis (strain DSM 16069 / JCM 12317 / KCTC 12182 / SW-125) TaxID=523791 RepID=C7R910_KANKD|nr:hypothetical protein [Kangiella koreensis]ACV27800.1 hypothetical protein Kkor_2391 [Kangiella koreensis DSM 16069]
MSLNRTQAFELLTSLLIALIGCYLAYFGYSSWMLAITGAALFVLSSSRVLRRMTRRSNTREAQHAN